MKKIILISTSIAISTLTLGTVVACAPKKDGNLIELDKNWISNSISSVGYSSETIPSGQTFKQILNKDIAFISDGNIVEDNSFNQEVIEGIQQSRGITTDLFSKGNGIYKSVYSKDINTQKINIEAEFQKAINDGKKLIVAAGFKHKGIISKFAKANENVRFIIVDGESVVSKKQLNWNVASIRFDVSSPSFLMGVLAAKKALLIDPIDPVVSYYGGQNIDTVNLYIKSFEQGIAYFNEKINKGILVDTENGGYAGNFNFGPKSKSNGISKRLTANGADVLLSVGGEQYKDAIEWVKRIKNKNAKIIGVDISLGNPLVTGPIDSKVVYGSILKNIKGETNLALQEIKQGGTKAGKYFGHLRVANLKNNGSQLSTQNVRTISKKTITDLISKELAINSEQVENIYKYATATK